MGSLRLQPASPLPCQAHQRILPACLPPLPSCPPIADHGHGFMPSYVYRQLTEFYHRQDFILDKRQLDQLIG